jgi:hypothetical protein
MMGQCRGWLCGATRGLAILYRSEIQTSVGAFSHSVARNATQPCKQPQQQPSFVQCTTSTTTCTICTTTHHERDHDTLCDPARSGSLFPSVFFTGRT